jgi:hypothetical protein
MVRLRLSYHSRQAEDLGIRDYRIRADVTLYYVPPLVVIIIHLHLRGIKVSSRENFLFNHRLE